MSERKNTYTPMPDANTSRIRTNATLPFHLENRVGLNTEYIHALLQIGGIGDIKITNSDGEVSHSQLSIMGFGKDGSALAGAGKTKTIDTFKFRMELENPNKSKQSQWPCLTLDLNTLEMKQRILNSDKIVTHPDDWSKEINNATREAILRAGTKHLLTGLNRKDKLSLALITCVNMGIIVNQFRNVIIANCLQHITESMSNGFEQPGKGHRMSLFFGFEADRALLLNIYGRFKPIAKSLENKTK